MNRMGVLRENMRHKFPFASHHVYFSRCLSKIRAVSAFAGYLIFLS